MKIILVDDNVVSCAALGEYFVSVPEVEVVGAAPVEAAGGAHVVSVGELSKRPFRLGAVHDGVKKVLKRLNGEAAALVRIGVWRLDAHMLMLEPYGEGGGSDVQAVKLTEKECDILLALHRREGDPVSREDLLREVWAYADGVETHTIETHIYRLRQKIEVDPAQPAILMTVDDGYYLSL